MLKVFEAFAGYGSQRMALRNLKIPHEVVGVSEIEGDVLLSYAAIHSDFLKLRKDIDSIVPDDDSEIINFLEDINVPLNYKTFENRAKKLKKDKLKEMYLANKLIKNFGDITKIDPNLLPDFDLFTYSFPCQDISVAGFQSGLNADSGTRSSLLWECCKIIEIKKPKYLMMENVKNLVGSNHRNNFIDFLKYLETLGYKNNWTILNARDYGIPQNRERVFCISVLGDDSDFRFPAPITLDKTLYDYLETNVNENYYLKKNQILDTKIKQDVSYCIDSNYWKGTTLDGFLKKHRRQLVTDRLNQDGKHMVRRLTPKETWRLMGCSDNDFEKASVIVSNTSLYKQSGNSIVVSVLEVIFSNLFLQSTSKNNLAQENTKLGHQYSWL